MINQSVTRSAEYCNILKNWCDSSRQSLDCLKPQRTRGAQRRKKEILFSVSYMLSVERECGFWLQASPALDYTGEGALLIKRLTNICL